MKPAQACEKTIETEPSPHSACATGKVDRRALLVGGGVAAAGLAALPLVRDRFQERQPVFIARGQRYDADLSRTIRDGLSAVGLTKKRLRGKQILLKPNLVEPRRDVPHMTTHPAVVVAAAETIRSLGAQVIVGEAPGHVRDTQMALYESRLREALDDAAIPFADLNYEDVVWVENRARCSSLEGLYLPQSVAQADLVISMPKLKSHHWVGITASMKNLYGVLPGIMYGWPKNVLHHHGIHQTVVDINSALPATAAIVDGIECMEGDGPIMGTPKSMGLIAIAPSHPSLDATLARLIDLEPTKIGYLALADERIGPIAENRIEQRGERWESVASRFEIVDAPHLTSLRA